MPVSEKISGMEQCIYYYSCFITRKYFAKKKHPSVLLVWLSFASKTALYFMRFTLSSTETDDGQHMTRKAFWDFRVKWAHVTPKVKGGTVDMNLAFLLPPSGK